MWQSESERASGERASERAEILTQSAFDWFRVKEPAEIGRCRASVSPPQLLVSTVRQLQFCWGCPRCSNARGVRGCKGGWERRERRLNKMGWEGAWQSESERASEGRTSGRASGERASERKASERRNRQPSGTSMPVCAALESASERASERRNRQTGNRHQHVGVCCAGKTTAKKGREEGGGGGFPPGGALVVARWRASTQAPFYPFRVGCYTVLTSRERKKERRGCSRSRSAAHRQRAGLWVGGP